MMKSSRVHYRPLFGVGVGRSPPFLVAALTIGLCILAVSYWRLALQYHDLEEQLKRMVQKRDSLEANQNFINKQLEIREENFSEAKVSLQKKEQEVEDLKKKQDQTGKELGEIKTSLEQIKAANDKLKADTAEKERNLELLRSQNKALEEDKSKLDTEIKELKQKLANATLNQQSSQPQAGGQNSNIQRPDTAAKDPVYNLVNSVINKAKSSENKPASSVAAGVAPQPPPVPKPSNTNSDQQIAPPPEPKKKTVGAGEDLKVAESKQNVDIIDPANMPMDDPDMEKDEGGHGDQNHESNQDIVDQAALNKNKDSINYEVDKKDLPGAGGSGPGKNGNDGLIDSNQQL